MKGHKTAEHVNNPRENSNRNQQVLEASDLATEYSEMVDNFERLYCTVQPVRGFLLMPLRFQDAMSTSLHEHYERPVRYDCFFMYIMNHYRKNLKCQDCFDWL
jgi:hypothetical protein